MTITKSIADPYLPMPDRAAPVLVLIHGLLSTPQEFALLMHPLRRSGVDCIALRIPAFTEHPRRDPNGWRDWIESAAREIETQVPADRSIVLGGLCIGGVLAAALVLREPHRYKKLAMLSPTFDYDGWGLSRWTRWRHLGYALGLSRWIGIRERPPYGIKNTKIRARIAAQMRADDVSNAGPAKLPLWAIREGERMMAWVRPRLDELRLPTLVMHARHDEICRLASVESLMQRIGAPNKRLVVLENSYHMITIDNDRARVAQELAAFCANDAALRVIAGAGRATAERAGRLLKVS